MFRGIKENKYPIIIIIVCLFFVIVPAFFEIGRVFPQHRADFIFLRGVNAFLLVLVLFWFLLRPVRDLALVALSVIHTSYCVYSSWYFPLYEFAFFQGALALCFMNFKRRWIYPMTQVMGGLVFGFSQWLQYRLSWQVPQAEFADYLIVTATSVLLTMILHRYVYQARVDKDQMLLRYSIVGREATRLLHDVKGMLGSPLLIAGGLIVRSDRSMSNDEREGLLQLHRNLVNMQDVVYNLNRLVSKAHEKSQVSLLSVISRSLSALGARSGRLNVLLPEDRTIEVIAVKMESVFFNLFLNSVQAMEAKKKADAQVVIEWDGDCLVYRDNIGFVNSKKELGTSIGHILIESDLKDMGVTFEQKLDVEGITIRLGHLIVKH